ncbi:hypothetical protein [Sphingobium aquiterrae]|uniref:hypothetical protein n=1 Tax=Sphingobium TaxID=165695 RepID=UPI00301A373F
MNDHHRPEAELRVTFQPYVAFSIMAGGITFVGLATMPPIQLIGIDGDPSWSYYIFGFGLFSWVYLMFSIYWHQHIIDGANLIFKRGMKYGFIPIKKIIPIFSITRLKQERDFYGREFEGLSIYYRIRETEEKISIVLEAHRPADLRHFLTVLQRKRPDLDIPLLDGSRTRGKTVRHKMKKDSDAGNRRDVRSTALISLPHLRSVSG